MTRPNVASEPIGLRSALLAVLVSILWGGNVVSIRIGVDSVPPLWSAFWRMLAGMIFVWIWAKSQRLALWPERKEWKPLFLLGLIFTIQIGLLNSGTAQTSPAFAVVILNSYPVFANLAGHFFSHLETPITRIRAFGLALAIAGVAVLGFGQQSSTLAPNPLLGNALLVLSSALLGIRQVYTRWLVQDVNPTRAVVWQMAWSVPIFLTVASFVEPPVRNPLTWQAVAAIGYQALVVAGFCFIAWAALLKRHPAGTLSMYAFLVPLSGIALSNFFFHEPVQPTLLLGGALVLAGIAIVTRD